MHVNTARFFGLIRKSLLGKLLKTSGLKIYIHSVTYHTSHVTKRHRKLSCHDRHRLLPWVGECSFFYCKEQTPILCIRAFRVSQLEDNNRMLATSCCPFSLCLYPSTPSFVSGFFIDIKSFRSHYGPGVDSTSNRTEYQEYFLGVKAAGA